MDATAVIADAKEAIFKNLQNQDLKNLDGAELRGTIRKASTNFFFKNTKRKPMIISVVVEVDDL